MSALNSEKRRAREKAAKARHDAFHTGVDDQANLRMRKFLSSQHGNIIASYMPIGTEISTLSTMHALIDSGKEVCVPVVVAKDEPLIFKKWTPDTKMIKGAFGALVPDEAEQLIPDIVIVPLLAYDDKGNRLGYGGGFYDRSLEQIAFARGVNAVGFAYSAQRVARLPVEPTDYILDYVVTEKEVLSF